MSKLPSPFSGWIRTGTGPSSSLNSERQIKSPMKPSTVLMAEWRDDWDDDREKERKEVVLSPWSSVSRADILLHLQEHSVRLKTVWNRVKYSHGHQAGSQRGKRLQCQAQHLARPSILLIATLWQQQNSSTRKTLKVYKRTTATHSERTKLLKRSHIDVSFYTQGESTTCPTDQRRSSYTMDGYVNLRG